MLRSCLHVRLPVNITAGFAYIPPRSIYRIWFCFHSAISRALPIQEQLLMIQWVSVWFASLHWQGTAAPIRAIKARQSGWQLLMRLMRTDSNQPLSMCGYFLCPHSLSLSNLIVGFSPILAQFLQASQITVFFFQHLLGYSNIRMWNSACIFSIHFHFLINRCPPQR